MTPDLRASGAQEARARGPLFIVLDGVDGCGKSTQAKRLTEALIARGGNPLHLREPGSTGAGEAIRALLLDPEATLGAASELLLFAAARRQMLDELVQPALESGRDVVCERFHGSTFAYQAVAGGLPPDDVLALLERWASSQLPDLELILELDPARAGARRSGAADRIELKGLEFQLRVAAGYAEYVERVPRARRIDAEGDVEAVHARIMAEVCD